MNTVVTDRDTAIVRLPDPTVLPEFTPDMASIRRERIVGFGTRNIDARPFNLLRTQVAKKCAANGWSSIGITSAAPAAGKSMISVNLAASLSRVGDMPVYLFDFDLTRASVADYLGMEPQVGIEAYLDGRVDDLAQVGVRVADTSLVVFPAAEPADNTAELLASPRFQELTASFRAASSPRLILCDLPPTFANDDAMIATQQMDAYLLVVDAGQTTRRQIQDSCKMLEPTPRLGAVLNRYQGGFSDPYGYGSYKGAYSAYYY